MSDRLDQKTVEAIAARVVELLGEKTAPPRLVSAEELGRRLGLARSTVYEKADELGAIRIGTGPRARLRFDLELVAERLGLDRTTGAAPPAARPARTPRRGMARRRPGPDLLPIRGEVPR